MTNHTSEEQHIKGFESLTQPSLLLLGKNKGHFGVPSKGFFLFITGFSENWAFPFRMAQGFSESL